VFYAEYCKKFSVFSIYILLNGDLMSELTDFRMDKDEFFKHDPQSPFTPEQQQVFTGLEYFPENDDLRLEVTVEKFSDQQPMQMQTSTGGVQTYVRYGRFKFQVDGQPADLTIYQSGSGYFPTLCRFARWYGDLSRGPLSRAGAIAG
jgi:uncharacterized protein (DUF1684 family)